MTPRQRQILVSSISVLIVYVLFATTLYRFRHPEQTDTQLFQNLPRALMLQP
jgi:hypothetical protein